MENFDLTNSVGVASLTSLEERTIVSENVAVNPPLSVTSNVTVNSPFEAKYGRIFFGTCVISEISYKQLFLQPVNLMHRLIN